MLSAGKYYVGDLCYVLDEHNGFDWQDVLDVTGYLGIRIDPDEVTGYFHYNGVKLFSSTTAHGDGRYSDDKGREYLVDAGLIGCIAMSDLPAGVDTAGGNVVEFDSDFSCHVCDDDGTIVIGDLCIETGFDEDEDEGCSDCGRGHCDGDCGEDEDDDC